MHIYICTQYIMLYNVLVYIYILKYINIFLKYKYI
jgi:hypothetical protein